MAESRAALWLRAVNPFVEPRGMAEAQRAARALWLGLLVSGVPGVVASWWMMNSDYLAQTMAAQNSAMGLDAEQLAMQEAMMDAIMPFAMGAGIVFTVVLYAVLGWAQWRYMTRAIPIVLLVLAAYGAISNVVVHLVPQYAAPDMPVGLTLTTWAAFAVSTGMYVASLKGAALLHRLRDMR